MISYDSNVLIYFLESHPEFGAAAKDVIIQNSKDGVVLSMLVKQEVLTGFALRNTAYVEVVGRLFDSLENTRFMAVTDDIIREAVRLTSKYGRKVIGYDAIHIATAILGGSAVFYTNDQQLFDAKIDEILIKLV